MNIVFEKSKILSAMVRRASENAQKSGSYKCHSDSPYGDGYGDSQYGDSSD